MKTIEELYIEELYKELSECFNKVKLGVAGRFVYFDKELNLFILAVHSTSPDDTQRAGDMALNAIKDNILVKINNAGYGFAVQQI